MPEKLRQDLRRLPKGVLDHCERISRISRALAVRHGYNPEKAEATALIHDIARAVGDRELRDLANELGLQPSKLEEDLPILIHGPVGAALLRRDFGLADGEILDAVACHTTGRPGMGMLDNILFLADKLDPEKVSLRPELAEVSDVAERDLDAASLRFFDLQLSFLIARKQAIHPRMVEARNDLLAKRACDSGD